ncbi:MAG TPA: hypothetical protein VFE05_17570 [Longimicrobiaceae bacterium]|nr:hypothetical protein [Longimicrobiaceae bacterium]
MESSDVLAESPSPIGVVFWLSVRDVSLWAQTEPGDRPHLFADGASSARLRYITETVEDSALASYLSIIAAMVGVPESVTASGIAVACSDAAGWAAAHGLPRTALAFHQAAALVDPSEPSAPLQAGLSAAAVGDLQRAETWLRHAIGVARRARERTVYALAAASLSRILLEAKRGEDAELQAYKGLRAARRAACGEARGEALYVLFRRARDDGRDSEADRLAAAAARVLGRLRHHLLPFLLIDVARSLLDREEATRAYAILTSMPTLPQDHFLVAAKWALRCRLFAVTGDREKFAACWSTAWETIRHLPKHAPSTLVFDDLVSAALRAGDRRRQDRITRLRQARGGG